MSKIAGNQAVRRPGRSILAILTGFVVVIVLSIGTDETLRIIHVFPPILQPMSNRLFALATVYRIVYGIAGSYITARLAPNRPMDHALFGGAVGLVLAIVGAAVSWNHPEFGPHWYPMALIVTALPCAWLGGWLLVVGSRTPA